MSKIRNLNSKYFRTVPLASLDYYKKDSHGKDDFSRKQAWFYSYGDEEIEEEFKKSLNVLFEKLFEQDDIDWDMVTLYPTHSKGEVNPNLRALFLEVSAEAGIPMQQALQRTEKVRENHMINGERAKAINLEGSVDVTADVENKNIILVDNIALSGISLLHGTDLLRKQGAKNVFAVSLGTALNHRPQTRELKENESAGDILQKIKLEVEKG